MDWTPVVPVIGAVILGGYRLVAYLIRVRAIMRATPEQLAALDKVEPPVFIRRSGPALVLLATGAALSAWPLLKEQQIARRLDATGGGHVAKATSEERSGGCSELNCPRPGRCVNGKCEGAARRPAPVPRQPAPTERPRAAIAGQPDSALEHPNTWESSPSAFADRVPWLDRR